MRDFFFWLASFLIGAIVGGGLLFVINVALSVFCHTCSLAWYNGRYQAMKQNLLDIPSNDPNASKAGE